MTPKSVIILAIATAAAAAAAAASLNVNHGYSSRAGAGAVFPGLLAKLDTVTKVSVDHKDGGTVIVRAAGGAWTVPASDDYPASLPQVQKSILQLARLEYLAKKTAKPKFYSRLHLEDMKEKDTQARRIRLFDAKGATLAELIVGKKRLNLPGTAPEGAYIRKPGDPQTWLASGEIDVQTELKSWLRSSILNIREEDVLKLEVRHPGGEVVRISKENPKDRNFTLHGIPDDKKLQYDSDPDNVANVVEDLVMVDVRKAEKIDFPADKTVNATYTSRSGLVAELWLTAKGEDEWLKVKLTANPDAPAPKGKGQETAAQIAKRVTHQTAGWAFKIVGFKAERLRRSAAKMLVDKKAGS